MEVRVSPPRGPLFDRRAGMVMGEAMQAIVDDVAAQGFADVRQELDRVIRNPTPYYETQIDVDRVAADRRVIHDRDIVYGPWLEGVGSRNRSTRFKGYFTFRRVGQALQVKAPAIAQRTIAPYVTRLNGQG